MSQSPTLYRIINRLLAPLGLRMIRVTPDRVRGVDLFLDLKCLLAGRTDLVILDVGANRGDTVAEFREHFGRPSIIAFEPFEECYQALKERFREAGGVRLEQVALGATRETRPLHVYSGNNMNSLLPMDDQSGNVLRQHFSDTGTVEVKVETLDDFCRDNQVGRVDILKVDTQGFDLQVLKGAEGLLRTRRIQIVLLEVNFIPMYQSQARFSEIHEYLSAHGYRFVDFYTQVYHQNYTAWCDACYIAAET